ncbi:MAG TPA: bifunctional tetrahydrofolate synthase/dihydrofolate synthase, partial [Gammaproteobacteria bacterium]
SIAATCATVSPHCSRRSAINPFPDASGAPTHTRAASASTSMRFNSLPDWLRWQETLNPRGIDLGLDRCRPVFDALGLGKVPHYVISVAGTNGKGSCVSMLESVFSHAGYRVGSYTSPHLTRFNETIRCLQQPESDDDLIRAFQLVDEARGRIPLTWFEFRTLAAAHLFRSKNLDLVVMEVGLGGRLDAVNLFDADVALITSIGIDHRDWLGNSREEIAAEKSGICRAGRPLVCGDLNPPAGFAALIENAGASLYLAGHDFRYEVSEKEWCWAGPDREYSSLPVPGIPGPRQINNAATALMAVELCKSRFAVDAEAICRGLATCRLPGRLQSLGGDPATIVDVAHNPQAAEALAEALEAQPRNGCTRAVFGMYADKDIEGVVRALRDAVDEWHVASLPPPRGAEGRALASALLGAGVHAPVSLHDSVGQAIAAARSESRASDRIVVFGSFETVRQVIELET